MAIIHVTDDTHESINSTDEKKNSHLVTKAPLYINLLFILYMLEYALSQEESKEKGLPAKTVLGAGRYLSGIAPTPFKMMDGR